jgi:hypothetical protein
MSNEMKWQPIETAPKDGRALILCWAIDADGRRINWNEEMQSSGVFVQVASWWPGTGWVVYCSLIEEPLLHFDPTHWMPLPEPPRE